MNTSITTRPEVKEIYLRDLTDVYNLTSGYNKATRSIKKAITYIEANRERLEQMSFWKVIQELEQFNLNIHTYCAMD